MLSKSGHWRALTLPLAFIALVSCTALETQLTVEDDDDYETGLDTTITGRVRDALTHDHQVKAFHINVDTVEGVVELSGFVDTPESEIRAVRLAQQAKGVTIVKDSLLLTSEAPAR